MFTLRMLEELQLDIKCFIQTIATSNNRKKKQDFQMREICQKHGLILPITITNSNILVIYSVLSLILPL